MKSANRRRALLERVRDAGYVDAGALSRHFDVDGSTIRRDLAQLERAGLIKRTHGGVLPAEPGAVIDVPYRVREQENLLAKQAIARMVVDMVADGETVILDNGSTIYQVALELRRRKRLNVVTNDLQVGMQIAHQPGKPPPHDGAASCSTRSTPWSAPPRSGPSKGYMPIGRFWVRRPSTQRPALPTSTSSRSRLSTPSWPRQPGRSSWRIVRSSAGAPSPPSAR